MYFALSTWKGSVGRRYVLGYSVLRSVVVSMKICNKLPQMQKGVESCRIIINMHEVGGMRLTSLVINLFQNYGC